MLFILATSLKCPLTFYKLVYLSSLLSSFLCIRWNFSGIFLQQNFTPERKYTESNSLGNEIGLQLTQDISHAYYYYNKY